MQTGNLYNGREPEVIGQFSDGSSYSKTKLEASLRELVGERKPSVKSLKGQVAVKKDDVDLIVKEFEIPAAQAEKVLSENGGDLEKTLRVLVAS
ncbi:hypothetical protein PAXINDRAFT_131849 [Paxillus involutus ATCC 200175]|nr:hypothetical protein PAXINDRAFT_131849 [Paxillus involutus ATCC 200175]